MIRAQILSLACLMLALKTTTLHAESWKCGGATVHCGGSEESCEKLKRSCSTALQESPAADRELAQAMRDAPAESAPTMSSKRFNQPSPATESGHCSAQQRGAGECESGIDAKELLPAVVSAIKNAANSLTDAANKLAETP